MSQLFTVQLIVTSISPEYESPFAAVPRKEKETLPAPDDVFAVLEETGLA